MTPEESIQAGQASRPQYTKGTLAEALGIQSNEVVYYERIVLLPKPPRVQRAGLVRIKFIRRARDQLSEINQRIAQLNALRRSLNDLIAQCDQGKISDTQIIKALSPRTR